MLLIVVDLEEKNNFEHFEHCFVCIELKSRIRNVVLCLLWWILLVVVVFEELNEDNLHAHNIGKRQPKHMLQLIEWLRMS